MQFRPTLLSIRSSSRLALLNAILLLSSTSSSLFFAQDASAQDASAQDASAQDASAQDASAQDASAQDASAQDASAQDASAQETPTVSPTDDDTPKTPVRAESAQSENPATAVSAQSENQNSPVAPPPLPAHAHKNKNLPHTHLKATPKDESTAQGECKKGVPCLSGNGFAIWPSARVLGGYRFVQPDTNVGFIGQNDGFFVDQMRIGVEGNWGGRLDFRLVADGVSFLPNVGKNDPLRSLYSNLRDAYIRWHPSQYINAWAGQFYVPNSIESFTSRAALPFSSRSIASDGVQAGLGYAARGLGTPRQLGVMVGAEKAPIGPVHLTYKFALANGNGINTYGNDNKLPALFTRIGAGYGELVDVGLGFNYNPTTTGQLPSLFAENEVGGFFDIAVRLLGFEMVAQVLARSTSFETVIADTDPNRTTLALGATAWISIDKPLGFDLFGLNPAFRVSYLDPSSAFDDDQVLETSFALRYEPSTEMPVAFIFDVTLLFEMTPTGQRSVDNHRATAMMVFDL